MSMKAELKGEHCCDYTYVVYNYGIQTACCMYVHVHEQVLLVLKWGQNSVDPDTYCYTKRVIELDGTL